MAIVEEEAGQYKCRKFTNLWAIDGNFWIGDGVPYYPLSTTKVQQPNKTPDEDSTTAFLVSCS